MGVDDVITHCCEEILSLYIRSLVCLARNNDDLVTEVVIMSPPHENPGLPKRIEGTRI